MLVLVDHVGRFADWVARYERAWRTPGTASLVGLFTPDATYLPDPFAEPIHGLKGIGEFWEAERAGPDEDFALTYEVVPPARPRESRAWRSPTASRSRGPTAICG